MSTSSNPPYVPNPNKRTATQALGPNLTGGTSGFIGLNPVLTGETLTAPTITGNINLSGSAGILWANSSTGNFDMSNSSGTFKTGTGAISLNANTTITAEFKYNSTNLTAGSAGGGNADIAIYSNGIPSWEITNYFQTAGTANINDQINYYFTGPGGGNKFNIFGSGHISTANNTLDDGSGNILINGLSKLNGVYLNTGLTNISTRPALSTALQPFEVRALDTNGTGADDGFIRICAGGGTDLPTQSAIEISGYSTVSDMDRNIVFKTAGAEQMRISNSGSVSTSHNILDDGSGNTTLNTGGTTSSSSLVLQANAVNKMLMKWDSTNGCQIIDSNNTHSWLIQGGTTAGSVKTSNNTLDDGSGNIIIAGGINTTGTTGNTSIGNSTGTATIVGSAVNINGAAVNINTTPGTNTSIGNSTGTLTLNDAISQYKGITTTGLGVPLLVASVAVTGQTTNYSNSSLYSVPSTGNVDYLIYLSLIFTAYTSGSLNVSITYFDENNSGITYAFPFFNGTSMVTSIGGTYPTYFYIAMPLSVRVKASTTIQIGTVGTFVATYNLSAKVVQINSAGL